MNSDCEVNLHCVCHLRNSQLPVSNPLPFFECHDNCLCSNCLIRPSQHLSNIRVYLQPIGSKGIGLFTSRPIEKGTVLGEYVGEVIDVECAQKRIASYLHRSNYLLVVRENLYKLYFRLCLIRSGSQLYRTCVDATRQGNFTR